MNMMEFAAQFGIPATIGVVLVFYLVKVIIPKQLETIDKQSNTFQKALTSQQAIFTNSLKAEQDVHRGIMKDVLETTREEGRQTREVLSELNRSTNSLSKAVYKLYGKQNVSLEEVPRVKTVGEEPNGS